MPLKLDKDAQAWMGTQIGEMKRKKREETRQTSQSENTSLAKRSDTYRIRMGKFPIFTEFW